MTDPATSEAAARAIKDAISRIQTSNTGYIGQMQALSNTLSNRLLARISEEAARVVTPMIEAAALERAGGWQPIAILPEKDGPYLVFMPDRSLDQFSVQHCDHVEGGFTNDRGITHWHPLPAPPAESSAA
jgi:hypothetical protein